MQHLERIDRENAKEARRIVRAVVPFEAHPTFMHTAHAGFPVETGERFAVHFNDGDKVMPG